MLFGLSLPAPVPSATLKAEKYIMSAGSGARAREADGLRRRPSVQGLGFWRSCRQGRRPQINAIQRRRQILKNSSLSRDTARTSYRYVFMVPRLTFFSLDRSS